MTMQHNEAQISLARLPHLHSNLPIQEEHSCAASALIQGYFFQGARDVESNETTNYAIITVFSQLTRDLTDPFFGTL